MRIFLHEKSSSSTYPFLPATKLYPPHPALPTHPHKAHSRQTQPTRGLSTSCSFFNPFSLLFCILYTNGCASDFFLPFCSPRARGSSRQSRSAENTKHKEKSILEQQIKPHRNLFAPTIAQKNKHLTATALLPTDKYYRTYLEPYLNDVVYIECPRWYIKPDFVDGRPGDQILLLDAILVSAKHHEIQRPIPIPHIWTVVDSEWKHRVHVNSAGKLYLKGFLYLYGHKGVKNIGFQTLYAKALRC